MCRSTCNPCSHRRSAAAVDADAEAFADENAALLPDRERRARMADEARVFAREGSARAMAVRMAEIFREVTAPTGADPALDHARGA